MKIDTSHLLEDDRVHTTLAFVHTFPDGDREFSFYRDPGADMIADRRGNRRRLLEEAKIFHFGTLSMTHDEVRKATKKALNIAKKSGTLISF